MEILWKFFGFIGKFFGRIFWRNFFGGFFWRIFLEDFFFEDYLDDFLGGVICLKLFEYERD